MKNYVQYHNASKQGLLQIDTADFQIFANKSINHLVGHRVWLISGHGMSSPKHYQLEYVFRVDDVQPGTPNRARGATGRRFAPALALNGLSWFEDFLKHQANFSLGVREIADEHQRELEALLAAATS